MFPCSLIILMHVRRHIIMYRHACTHTHALFLYLPPAVERTRAQHTRTHSHTFSETKGRADCNIFLHFKKVASVKMINEGSWGRACILTLDCTRASRAATAWANNGFRWFQHCLRLSLLHRRSRHANYMPQQWLAVWNYYQHYNNIFTATNAQGVWPDITSGWMGEMLCSLYRCWLVKGWLLISRRWIQLTDVYGEHLIGRQTADAGRRGDIFKHHL